MADVAQLDSWLRHHALTLKHVAVGVQTDDLRPLRRSLERVRVIGLGETTHGTKEFFQVRHRLLQFLVETLGFNVLALEASFATTRLVNDYVTRGEGDRDCVLTGMGSVMWDVLEFGDVVDWLKSYNRSVADERKVQFLGVDIFHTRAGREQVLAWLRRVAPYRVASAESVFQAIGAAEARGLLVAHEALHEGIATGLGELIDALRTERHALLERTSVSEYEGSVRQLEVILQWVEAYGVGGTPSTRQRGTGLNNYTRSLSMADNLVHYIKRVKPDARIALWAHNFHVSVGFHDAMYGMVPNFGQRLRDTFGTGYYALGLELNRGEYLCREWGTHGRTLGDLKVARISPSSPGWLPWQLARAGRQFILDLRASAARGDVASWLELPHTTFCAGWAQSDPTLTTQVVLARQYDGILFIENTSATTPTANAISTVARRASH
jgi:erythromycin esterase